MAAKKSYLSLACSVVYTTNNPEPIAPDWNESVTADAATLNRIMGFDFQLHFMPERLFGKQVLEPRLDFRSSLCVFRFF